MGEAVALGITLALSAGGTAASISQAKTAQKKEENAQKIARRQAQIENQRNIRKSLAAAAVDRANLLNSGQAGTGGFASSGIQGGAASAGTQQAANLGFARTSEAANAAVNSQLRQANAAQSRAASFGAIANLPSQFGFSASDTFQDFFKKGPTNAGSGPTNTAS